MKFCFFILCILLASNYTAAQQGYLGIKTNIGFNNVTYNGTLKTTNYNPSFNAAITFEKSFKNNYFWGIDLMYQKLGFIEPFTIINNFGKTTGETGQIIYTFSYINMPISVGIYTGSKWKKLISLALISSILVNANTTVLDYKTNGKQKPKQSFDKSDEPNKFDLSGQINLGIGRQINNKTLIYSTAGFQKSFTNLSNDSYFLDADLKHYSISIAIGIKYACF
jgi:hypothetical protein